MKKIICFILVFSFLLLFTGCNQPKSNIEVSSFSYSEHAEIYKDNNPGVKHDTLPMIYLKGEEVI